LGPEVFNLSAKLPPGNINDLFTENAHEPKLCHRVITFTPLSVAQVRLLLKVALPQPVLDLPAALALIAYQQRHNYAAYCSHRKRLLAQLQELRW